MPATFKELLKEIYNRQMFDKIYPGINYQISIRMMQTITPGDIFAMFCLHNLVYVFTLSDKLRNITRWTIKGDTIWLTLNENVPITDNTFMAFILELIITCRDYIGYDFKFDIHGKIYDTLLPIIPQEFVNEFDKTADWFTNVKNRLTLQRYCKIFGLDLPPIKRETYNRLHLIRHLWRVS